MDFAKHHKLVAMKDAKGRPLYAKESYLNEVRTRSLTNPMKPAGKTRTFEFPDNRKAKQFAKDISNSGVATGTVSGNRVIDFEVLKGSDRAAQSTITRWLLKNKGKELNESVITKLQESYTSKMPVDIDINGEIIHITPDISENIISLHDELNEVNQIKLRQLISEDLQSFVEISKFAEKRNS